LSSTLLLKRILAGEYAAMTDDDTMDVLTGIGVLLALALFAAAWFHTFTEWERTFDALVAAVCGQGSRPGTFAHYHV
jgi:hypothetical protein